MEFACPSCHRSFRTNVGVGPAGARVRCTGCGHTFVARPPSDPGEVYPEDPTIPDDVVSLSDDKLEWLKSSSGIRRPPWAAPERAAPPSSSTPPPPTPLGAGLGAAHRTSDPAESPRFATGSGRALRSIERRPQEIDLASLDVEGDSFRATRQSRSMDPSVLARRLLEEEQVIVSADTAVRPISPWTPLRWVFVGVAFTTSVVACTALGALCAGIARIPLVEPAVAPTAAVAEPVYQEQPQPVPTLPAEALPEPEPEAAVEPPQVAAPSPEPAAPSPAPAEASPRPRPRAQPRPAPAPAPEPIGQSGDLIDPWQD